jgi:predicted nucleic acid-binding protein
MRASSLVADASAVVLAAIDRTSRGQAVLARLRTATVHAPHLVDVEVGSTLRRMVLRGELSLDDADEGRGVAGDLIDARYPHHRGLCDWAWAYRDQLTFHDAQYAALARFLGLALLTADARAARAPVRGVEFEVC